MQHICFFFLAVYNGNYYYYSISSQKVPSKINLIYVIVIKMKRWSQRILAWEQFLEVLDVLVEVLEVCIHICEIRYDNKNSIPPI